MILNKKIKKYSDLYFVLLLNIIIYSIVIVIYPGFISDDFLIFSLIAKNPNIPISLNPNDYFFLFFRPISYFSFYIDYNFLFENPYLMKYVSLILHLVILTILYFLINNFFLQFNISINRSIRVLSLLIFSLHLDVLNYIYWISNRTELLYLSFYLLALYSFVKYTICEKNIYLFIMFVSYIISILSKQTSLHLPFLIIFLLYLMPKFNLSISITKYFKKTIMVMIIAFIAYGILNYFNYSQSLNLSENIFKKPLSFLGNMLHVVIPVISQYIYNLFLLNKSISITLFAIVCIGAIVIVIFYKKFNKYIFWITSFSIIVSFPRILAISGDRINTIYLIYFIFALLIISIKLSQISLVKLLIMILIIYTLSFIYRVELHQEIFKHNELDMLQLEEIIAEYPDKQISIIVGGYTEIIPYEINYRKYNSFSNNEYLKIYPFYYDLQLVYYNLHYYEKEFIVVKKDGKNVKITSSDPLVYLSINEKRISSMPIEIKELIDGNIGREFQSISFLLKNEDLNSIFVYHNGKEWNVLN